MSLTRPELSDQIGNIQGFGGPDANAESTEISLQDHRPELFKGQKGAILQVLLDSRGKWIPAYELSKQALQYNARVFSLRREGYIIANKTERLGGKVHGSFRLVSEPEDRVEGEQS
jgi:hypothetical protein